MSLFPNEDALTKEIESWEGFADSLKSEKDRQYNLWFSFMHFLI
jgi:hypothetical protein